MAVFALTDAQFTLNTVNLSAFVTNIELSYGFTALPTTAMGATGVTNTKGLQEISATIELNNDMAAASVLATIFAAVGSGTNTYIIRNAGSGTPTPDTYTVSNAFLSSAPIVSGAVGDLSKISITLDGGTLVKT